MFFVRALVLAYLPLSQPFGSFFEVFGPEMPRNISALNFKEVKSRFRRNRNATTSETSEQYSMHHGGLRDDWYFTLF